MDWVPARFPNDAHGLAESAGTGDTRPTSLGGVRFGFNWSMNWMQHFLSYRQLGHIQLRFHQRNITFSHRYALQENFIHMLNHDEVVCGKRSLLNKVRGDEW